MLKPKLLAGSLCITMLVIFAAACQPRTITVTQVVSVN